MENETVVPVSASMNLTDKGVEVAKFAIVVTALSVVVPIVTVVTVGAIEKVKRARKERKKAKLNVVKTEED